MQPQKDMNGLKYEKLMDDPIVAVISTKNPLSSSSLLSIKDLRDEQFVAYYRSINLRDFTDEIKISLVEYRKSAVRRETKRLPA